jgi:hypothetical protein
MGSREDAGRAESNWQAESLRVTAFPVPGTPIKEPTWWSDLVGKPPEVRSKRLSQGTFQDEGLIQELKLTLSAQPSRIDWYLTLPEPGEASTALRAVGPLHESLKTFVPLMKSWLKVVVPPQRLAFGAALFQPVEDKISGYVQLRRYLPGIAIDPERSSDFSYQINRPRDSRTEIPGLRINRLSRWSVALRGGTQLRLSPHGVQAFSLGESLAVRLEIDINTPAEFNGELPRERLCDIFDELVLFGCEIAEKGDIA